jgi:hypothetical protein
MSAKAQKTDPISAIVDEIGVLEAELAPIKPKLNRLDALRRSIRLHCAGEAPTKELVIGGSHFYAFVGPCAFEQSVNNVKLAKLISPRAFVDLAKVALTDLKTSIEPRIAAAVIESAQTGTRPLKVVAKP